MTCPSLHKEVAQMIDEDYVDLMDYHPWVGYVLNTLRVWLRFPPFYKNIDYYTCDVIDEHGYPCPYQAILCKYKEQEEKFDEIVLGGINETRND